MDWKAEYTKIIANVIGKFQMMPLPQCNTYILSKKHVTSEVLALVNEYKLNGGKVEISQTLNNKSIAFSSKSDIDNFTIWAMAKVGA